MNNEGYVNSERGANGDHIQYSETNNFNDENLGSRTEKFNNNLNDRSQGNDEKYSRNGKEITVDDTVPKFSSSNEHFNVRGPVSGSNGKHNDPKSGNVGRFVNNSEENSEDVVPYFIVSSNSPDVISNEDEETFNKSGKTAVKGAFSNQKEDNDRRRKLLEKFGNKKTKKQATKDENHDLSSIKTTGKSKGDSVNSNLDSDPRTEVRNHSEDSENNISDANLSSENTDNSKSSTRGARFPNVNVLFQKYISKRDVANIGNADEKANEKNNAKTKHSNHVENEREGQEVSDQDERIEKTNTAGWSQKLRSRINGIRGTPVAEQNGVVARKDRNNKWGSSNEHDSLATETMCGGFGYYPEFLQWFATPRQFLLVFCLQNVLQGAAISLYIGTTTSIEKHFHFSSADIGSILMFSEIGPIFSSLILSHLGGLGNRPRWMAIGQFLSTLGMLLGFANYIFYPPPVIQELSAPSNRRLCRYSDLITETIVPLFSSGRNAASLTATEGGNCFGHNNTAFFSWVIVHTLIGVGNSMVYCIGAPYLDDSIKKKDTPIYFAISISVRILGPILGFTATAALLKVYVHPFSNPGLEPSDPRWVGAWWIGYLVLGALFGAVAVVTAFFPRKMNKYGQEKPPDAEKGQTISITERRNVSDKMNGIVSFEILSSSSLDDAAAAAGTLTSDSSKIASEDRLTSDSSKLASEDEVAAAQESNGEDFSKSKDNKINSDFDNKSFKEKMSDLIVVLKRLSRNKVIVYGYCGDFFAMSGSLAIFMWLPKYLEHQFRVDKSTAALFTGISGMSSVILGVLGGGLFIRRCQPSAKTLTMLIIVCKSIYVIAIASMMHIHCDFNDDLPGVLSMDGSSLELYRGCSGGCSCSTQEFVPVCVRDGTLQVTFFSPCHAGCYVPPVSREGVTLLDQFGEQKALVEGGAKYYSNCSCGSNVAEVTTGYCRQTCSGFSLFNIVHVTVNSFVSLGTIGGVLIALRCVSEDDKASALGLKSSIISVAMLLNPVIFGRVTDSSCLVWEEACQETGACWVYNAKDLGYKLFTSAVILFIISVIMEIFVYRNVGEVKLFDEEKPRGDSTKRFSSTFSSTLSSVLGPRFAKRFISSKNSTSTVISDSSERGVTPISVSSSSTAEITESSVKNLKSETQENSTSKDIPRLSGILGPRFTKRFLSSKYSTSTLISNNSEKKLTPMDNSGETPTSGPKNLSDSLANSISKDMPTDAESRKSTPLVNAFRKITKSPSIVGKIFRSSQNNKSESKENVTEINESDEPLEGKTKRKNTIDEDLEDVTLENIVAEKELGYNNKSIELDTEIKIENTDGISTHSLEDKQKFGTNLSSNLRYGASVPVDSLENY